MSHAATCYAQHSGRKYEKQHSKRLACMLVYIAQAFLGGGARSIAHVCVTYSALQQRVRTAARRALSCESSTTCRHCHVSMPPHEYTGTCIPRKVTRTGRHVLFTYVTCEALHVSRVWFTDGVGHLARRDRNGNITQQDYVHVRATCLRVSVSPPSCSARHAVDFASTA